MSLNYIDQVRNLIRNYQNNKVVSQNEQLLKQLKVNLPFIKRKFNR